MRPVKTDKIFNDALDTLTCVWGGLVSPRLCKNELQTALEPYDFLVTFTVPMAEETHLSKVNYFAIAASEERTKDVGINACCMTALFAYENLKMHESYDRIKDEQPVIFLRHLRNASAHGNRFHFFRDAAKRHFIDPGIVLWKNKRITKDLQDTPAFPNFFTAGEFAYLFEDISSLII